MILSPRVLSASFIFLIFRTLLHSVNAVLMNGGKNLLDMSNSNST